MGTSLLRGLIVCATGAVAVACWQTRPNPLYCDSTSQCTDPLRPTCDVVAHECVGDDRDLSMPDGPSPDLTPECTGNAGCTVATKPICAGGTCQACTAGACASFVGMPVCATSGAKAGACVECTMNDHCAAAGKTCDTATNACVACVSNDQCTHGACRADGVCALDTDQIFVDNANGACTGSHTGLVGDPFCQVAPALAVVGKSTIVVKASTAAYNAIAVTTALDKAIVGPGRDVSPGVRIFEDTKVGLSINVGSGVAKVSATGLAIQGSNGAMKLQGVYCSGGGATVSLTLRSSNIVDSGGVALDSNSCAISVDSSLVTNNNAGGFKLSTTTYTITNNIIWLNGNAGTGLVPGVQLDSASNGTFSFNTVAKNFTSAGPAGIDCSGAVAHMITNSIVAQNSAPAGTQFLGLCTFDHVVSGTDTATGPDKSPPTFVSTSNFRLDTTAGANLMANQLCCIDKVAAGPDRDVDGAKRPKGASRDIGAHEAL